jgi:hypothetical protein
MIPGVGKMAGFAVSIYSTTTEVYFHTYPTVTKAIQHEAYINAKV